MKKLAVIIPVYGEKELVQPLYERLKCVLEKLPVVYEIIYVNDNCPYGSGDELEKLARNDENVTVIHLSRNFGEANAVKAGIDNCDADYAVIMDCDLQDLPEDIPAFYQKAQEGYDIVWGERIKREDNFIKKFYSKLFYFASNLISEIKVDKKIGSFSLVSKDVIEELKKINDYTFNYIQMVEYLGFRKTYVPITKAERPIGKSAYNFIKGAILALNIMVSTSNKPLFVPVISSILMFLLCFVIIFLYIIFMITNINFEFSVYHLFCILILFILGILFFNIGIISLYIGIILKETMSKPHYVIKNKTKEAK